MKNLQQKREVDGRYALTFDTRKSVVRFESREVQRKARQEEIYAAALARGMSEDAAEAYMYCMAV